MALYEAIRQGQAKIAQGLESGQMRSDGIAPKRPQKAIPDDKALLKNREKSPVSPLSRILAIVVGFAALVVVLFVTWFIIDVFRSPEPVAVNSDQTVSPTPENADEPARTAETTAARTERIGTAAAERTERRTPAQPSARSGQNVIVIQQVPGAGQQDKLRPVQEFYNARGIPTEMIQRSGYTLLITRAGFDYNPNRQGTEGYRLMQRIRQLGLAYPEAAGDTKFGLRPFQDAYALKK